MQDNDEPSRNANCFYFLPFALLRVVLGVPVEITELGGGRYEGSPSIPGGGSTGIS